MTYVFQKIRCLLSPVPFGHCWLECSKCRATICVNHMKHQCGQGKWTVEAR